MLISLMFTLKVATKTWIQYQRPSPKIFEDSLLQLCFRQVGFIYHAKDFLNIAEAANKLHCNVVNCKYSWKSTRLVSNLNCLRNFNVIVLFGPQNKTKTQM